MNVLIVGYGSIGRRHVDNLLQMDVIEHITVFTKVRSEDRHHGKYERIDFVDSADQQLSDLISSMSKNIHFAVIANETFKHIDTAVLLAKNGINLVIEKPLSHTVENTAALYDVAEKKKVKIFVGYNLRFLSAINLVRKHLIEKTIGDLYFAKIEVGQFLPSWRPERDYRKSYSARKDHGGGVALDLSHEIDYMRYLFGDPDCWYCVRGKAGNLDIDSDDLFEGIYEYENGFVCNTHMDYLQLDKKRDIRIIGSKGSIQCDLMSKYINISVNGKDPLIIEDHQLFNVNKTYVDEMESYIETIQENKEPLVGLNDGVQVLRLIENKNV